MAFPAHRPAWALTPPRWMIAVLLVSLVGGLGWQAATAYSDARKIEDRQHDREAVVEVARGAVTQLVSFRAETASADLDSLLDVATQRFRASYGEQVKTFRSAVTKRKVNSDGEAVSAAVASLTADKAEVIVAASAQVTSDKSRKPRSMFYRFSVTLLRVGETWKLDQLEFVA